MPRHILIITAIIVATIAIGVTAAFLILRQGGEEVSRQAEVATTTEESVAQPEGTTTPEKPATQLEEPTTTEPIDTSDWKVYRNEEYGFEIKYPRDLIGLERIYNTAGAGGINFKLPGQGLPDPHEPYSFFGRRYLSSGLPDPCRLPCSRAQIERVEIGGVLFTRSYLTNPDIPFSKLKVLIHYTGKHNDICYHLIYADYSRNLGKDELQKNIARFESIVSTFKLLDQGSIQKY